MASTVQSASLQSCQCVAQAGSQRRLVSAGWCLALAAALPWLLTPTLGTPSAPVTNLCPGLTSGSPGTPQLSTLARCGQWAPPTPHPGHLPVLLWGAGPSLRPAHHWRCLGSFRNVDILRRG